MREADFDQPQNKKNDIFKIFLILFYNTVNINIQHTTNYLVSPKLNI